MKYNNIYIVYYIFFYSDHKIYVGIVWNVRSEFICSLIYEDSRKVCLFVLLWTYINFPISVFFFNDFHISSYVWIMRCSITPVIQYVHVYGFWLKCIFMWQGLTSQLGSVAFMRNTICFVISYFVIYGQVMWQELPFSIIIAFHNEQP